MEDINNVEEIKDIEMLYDKCENMEQLYERYYLPLQQELDRANEKLKKIEDICDNEIQKYDWLIQEAQNNNDKEMFYTPIQYHSKINELKIILGIIKGDD